MKIILNLFYPIFLILLILSPSCTESTNPQTGTISVYAKDNDPKETPIPNAQITLIPGNIVKETDENGLCSFNVEPGDYFINAELCCVGPGYIHFHEEVIVKKGEVTKVELTACLSCE